MRRLAGWRQNSVSLSPQTRNSRTSLTYRFKQVFGSLPRTRRSCLQDGASLRLLGLGDLLGTALETGQDLALRAKATNNIFRGRAPV